MHVDRKPSYNELLQRVRELEKNEEALRKSEAKYRVLFENMAQGVFYQRADGNLVDVNPAALEMLGMSRDEFLGRTCMDPRWRAVAADGEPLSAEQHPSMVALRSGTEVRDAVVGMFNPRKKGFVWMVVNAIPLYHSGEAAPHQVFVTIHDITRQKTTEDELRKSESLLQRVFEILPVGLWFADPNGQLIRGNPAGVRIWGAEPHVGPERYGVFKARRLPSGEEIAPDDWALAHTIREGVTVADELLEIEAFDGQRKTILNYTAPVLDDHGRVEAAVIVNLDVSDHMRTQEALIYSEAHLKTLVDAIPDLVWLKDTEGVYLGCNPTFERFFGAREAEIIGRTDYDFVDRELADFFRMHDRRAMAAGGPSINEEWLTFAADGYHGLFETIKTPMYHADGRLIGVLGIARDVTARQRAEDALKENEQRYKSAQRMGRVGNWEYDLVTGKFWGSDEAKRLYGFAPDGVDFTTDEVERCIPERERVHQALVDLIEDEKPYDLEFEIRPISGPASRTIHSIAELVRDGDGKPHKVVGMIQDITEQRRAEKARFELESRLKQAQKMESIGTLAGGIAHDFNNILASVIGYSELALEEAPQGSMLNDNLQEVYTAAKRARDLVRQILTFARKGDEARKPIVLADAADEVTKLIRATIPAIIEVRKRIESTAMIMGNPGQIHQLLLNLCTNAAQAMEETGGILEIRLTETCCGEPFLFPVPGLPAGRYLKITVSDTGPGIAPEIIGRIFDPYFTTKDIDRGTGMGLALAHSIVESHGGRIAVDSVLGRGSLFTVFLPTIERDRNLPSPLPKPLPVGNEHILFVDDEPAIARMGGRILEGLGYRVTTCTDSIEALELFRAAPRDFDLVISDMTMPRMTGDALAKAVIALRLDIPVILCTGYSRRISDEKAAAIGIKALIHKPIVRAQLAETVRRILDAATAPAFDS